MEDSTSSQEESHTERSVTTSSSQPHSLDGIRRPDFWVAEQNAWQLGPSSHQPGPHSMEEERAFPQDPRPPVPGMLSPHEAEEIELAPRLLLGGGQVQDDSRGGF